MHRGCFVWTPTPALSGRRAPRPGPARVCVCVPFLAGSGGPASRARSGAPHLSCGRSGCAHCLFGPLKAWVALFLVLVGFFFSFPFPFAPPLFLAFGVFLPRVPWALASCCPPPPFFFLPCISFGLLFFFLPLLSLAFPVFRPRLPWASGPCCPPAPPPFFFLPPPCLFFFSSRFSFVFCFFAGCAVRGRFVCPGLLGVSVCALVVLSPRLLWARCSLVPLLLAGLVWCRLLCLGVCCLAWLSSVVSWWVLVSCFGGAVPVWPRCSPPCGLVWCVLVFCCPVLCSVALCCRVVVAVELCSLFASLPAPRCPPPPPFGFFFPPHFLFVFFFLLFRCSLIFCRLCGAGPVSVSRAVGCAGVCFGGAVPVVALCAVLARPSGVGWCCVVLPVVFGCLLLGLAVLCGLLVGLGVVFRWCRPCLAAWLAALWFGVVCHGVLLPCVVFCGAVLSCGGVLSCSAVCLRRCLCLLFVSCRCASAVLVLGCRAVRSLSSPPCAVLCCAVWCPCVVLSASSVVFLVPGVVGSWCRCLLLGVRWWLWLPGVVVWCCESASVPVSGLAVAQRLPCGVLLPCVVSCGAVLPCGAVLWCPVVSFSLFFSSLLVALVFCFPLKISCKTRENGFPFLKIN